MPGLGFSLPQKRPDTACASTWLRGIGGVVVLIGLAMLASATGVTNTLAQTAPPCNNQGLPDPCFFTPPIDTGTALQPLRSVEPKSQDP